MIFKQVHVEEGEPRPQLIQDPKQNSFPSVGSLKKRTCI